MEDVSSIRYPRMNWFDAGSGLILLLLMATGYIFGMQGFPGLGSADEVYRFYQSRGAVDAGVGCVLVTLGFFFAFWFLGVLCARMRAAEGPGHLTYISLIGGIAFTTVFSAGLAFVLAPAMLIEKGIDPNTIYLMHTASLLTGVTTAVFGPLFLVPVAILGFRTKFLPAWLTWFTVACAVGSLTPILGAFSLTGPLNVGNGWIGIHAVAASWVVWTGVASAYFLYLWHRGRAGAPEDVTP
jgi:hypothetical protein